MARKVALCGFIVLVVAMGIGRFAFTPQVPLMIRDGQLTLTSAGLVAAINYLGYLLGAWDAMRARHHIELRLYAGISGAVALTFLSSIADNALLHGALRLVIGAMSGWAMVLIAAPGPTIVWRRPGGRGFERRSVCRAGRGYRIERSAGGGDPRPKG